MKTETLSFAEFVDDCQARCEARLEQWLPGEKQLPERLHRAMRYSVLGGGKRIRPLLTYTTGVALGLAPEMLDDCAISVELIHAYSLVHDDLPAMDDDDLRRSKPSCHKAFDEATAILVGDALQTLAFTVLSQSEQINAAQSQKMVAHLAKAAGSLGMVGGQMLDMVAENTQLSIEQLETLHSMKTGALIAASVNLGAIAANANPKQMSQLNLFVKAMGLAFQIHDDILDVEEDTAQLGKPAKSDIDNHKATYPSILGLAEAKKRAKALFEQAMQALSEFDQQADYLRQLAEYIVVRRK